MRFVELEDEAPLDEAPLDVQAPHRVRSRLVAERTALINQPRAVLLERGVVVPKGRRKLEQARARLLDGREPVALGPRTERPLADRRAGWQALGRRIAALDAEFAERARADAAARRLATIPGIGVLNAAALVAAVGGAGVFARGP